MNKLGACGSIRAVWRFISPMKYQARPSRQAVRMDHNLLRRRTTISLLNKLNKGWDDDY